MSDLTPKKDVFPNRREVITKSVTCLTVGAMMMSCDDDGLEAVREPAGNNEIAGDSAGEIAGSEAGDSAGETAGETAGEQGLPDPEPVPIIPADPEPVPLFPYGVASGDPRQASVVIWTALDPRLANDLLDATQSSTLTIQWSLTNIFDESFSEPVETGTATISQESGFTLKLNVNGLSPDTRYRYRFAVDQVESDSELVIFSHTGLTRTLPENADEIRLALCSCANFSSGYYHAYRHLALTQDLHAVLHLGDYIYESTGLGDEVRVLEGQFEARDLSGYRNRYAEYRLDPDLQALHRSHPIISVWDDHEFENGAHQGGSSGTASDAWADRKANATQAYHEWLPTALQPDQPLYRSFDFGGIAEVFMLDTRIEGRDPQLSRAQIADRFNEDRQLLGSAQERWLFDGLTACTAPWKFLGQQVMMGHLLAGGAPEAEREQAIMVNADQWDGYDSSRRRLFNHVIESNISGLVTFSGDIHTSWASELSINPSDPELYVPEASEGPSATNRGGVGIEIVTPAVTSRALSAINDNVVTQLRNFNPHIKWFELTLKGFTLIKASATKVEITWKLFEEVTEPALPGVITAKTMSIAHASPLNLRLTSSTSDG